MARYTKKDADGRYYIESVNGKLESDKFGHTYGEAIDRFAELENADVAPRAEVFEEVDKFRADLMDKFIDLCRGNDYNKLTLLKIGDVVDEMYDRRIAELKKKYAEGRNDRNEK
jgi:hypothetical protein